MERVDRPGEHWSTERWVLASFSTRATVLRHPPAMAMDKPTSCGAVEATVKNHDAIDALPGNLPDLLEQILPSVLKVRNTQGDKLTAAIRQSAADAAHRITQMSTVLDAAARSGKLGIASGVYDLETGRFMVTNPG